LREGVSPDEIEELFVTAAGVLALSMYIGIGGAKRRLRRQSWNVTVSRRGAQSAAVSAATLRREAEAMLSAYLADRGFEFMGVRG
jgi:hypothetical protein